MGENKRRHKRVSETFIITYRLKAPFNVKVVLGNTECAAVAIDISEGGLGLDSTYEIPVSAKVSLHFTLLNELAATEAERHRVFSLEGESRYCEPTPERGYRVGVHFTNITPEQKEHIAGFVRDQSLKG